MVLPCRVGGRGRARERLWLKTTERSETGIQCQRDSPVPATALDAGRAQNRRVRAGSHVEWTGVASAHRRHEPKPTNVVQPLDRHTFARRILNIIRWISRTVLGIAAALPAAATAADSPEFEEFSRLADEAAESGAMGLAAVLEMGAWRDWIADDDALEAYGGVADATDDPTIRAVADYARARILHRQGRFDEADALCDEMGFVDAWALIGPFPNDGMSGLPEVFPPETEGVFDGPVDGKIEPVAWRAIEEPFETGYFPASDFARPAHSAAVYMATEFELNDDFEGVLSLAVDGAYRVWIDGEPLAEQPNHLGGFLLRDEISLELDDGTHTLLIKIAGIDGLLGLHARLLDEGGRALVVEFEVPTELPPAEPTESWPRPTTVADRLESELADAGADELAAAAYAVHSFQSADPNEPWREFAERAIAAEPGARGLLRLAAIAGEDWRRAELAERAVRMDPAPLHVTQLAEIRFGQMGVSSVMDAVGLLRPFPPEERPISATVLWSTMLAEFRFPRSALDMLLDLGDPASQPIGVHRAVLNRIAGAGREDLSAELLQSYLQRDTTAVAYYDDLFLALRAADRQAEFWTWFEGLEGRTTRRPDEAEDVSWLLNASGDVSGAEEVLSAAIERCPGEASLWTVRGRHRLRQNLNGLAADDYVHALALRPQDAAIRELVASLRPAQEQFYDEFRLGDDEVLARLPDEAPEAAYTRLVDQRVTRVFPNGLGAAYVQQGYLVHTRSGADELRRLRLVYTPGAESVEVLSAAVLKPDGTRIEVVDISDLGGNSGPASVYYDVRMRAVDFSQLEEGDVLVYEYVESDIAAQNMFDDYFGDLWFVEDYFPTSYSRYVLQIPAERGLFWGGSVRQDAWEERVEGDLRVLTLTREDVAALPREEAGPGPLELFEHASVSTYADWPSLADWYWSLVEDQLVTGPAIVEAVRELTDGVEDRREIVSRIYGYVVRNTRYVGLEFGIHGYKPYRTTDCFSRRFGDCKDTASLMKVMLGVAGIEAHLVLVRTSDLGTATEYPPSLSIFNHVITYVPEFDLYLDGTAGFSGSNELPTADQGATAVIVRDGEGGDYVTIPAAPASVNVVSRRFEVDLTGDEAEGLAVFTSAGAFASSPRVRFDAESGRDRLLERELARTATGVTLVDHSVSDLTDIETPVTVEMEFVGGEWAVRQDSGWVIRPAGRSSDLGNRYAGPLARTQPLEFEHPFIYEYEARFRLPPDWTADELPPPLQGSTEFGAFSVESSWSVGELSTTLRFELSVQRVEPDDYVAFREFVHAADEAFDRVARFNAGGAR